MMGLAMSLYQAGAWVFGGGHVVLPLLHQSIVQTGWLSADSFLAGYGAAQAVPGPMFSFAAFLGAAVPMGVLAWIGSMVALGAIFLPGFLILLAVLPARARVAQWSYAGPAIAGVNAAVVGLSAAALYDPLWLQAVRGAADVAIIAVGLVAAIAWRMPAVWLVAVCVVTSVLAATVLSRQPLARASAPPVGRSVQPASKND
jgi:chromate transporter